MSNFIIPSSVKHGTDNFGLSVTGNFNSLSSSGTFPLPNVDAVRRAQKYHSIPPRGSVQIAGAEEGTFDSNSNIYIRDEEIGEVDKATISAVGSNYIATSGAMTKAITGVGSGLTIDIISVDGNGGILNITVANGGLGYSQGDTVGIKGGDDNAEATIGATDLPFNRLVLDSSSAPNGEPISGLVMIPPLSDPNASWIARDGTIGYFKRLVSNFGYAQNDVITLDTPLGGTAAQITVTGVPGVNGQVGTGNTTLTNPGTNYVVGNILNQVATTGVGQFFTCQVSTITGGGSVGPIGSYTVTSQLRKDFQGYTEGTGWQSFTAQGGIASAAGNQYEIQYNNNNQLGASSNLKFDPTTNIFEVGIVSNVESTLTGSTTLQSDTAGNSLTCITAGGNNAGISLNTTNTSNSIALTTAVGGISTQSNNGPTSIRSQTGAIDLTRTSGSTTQVSISSVGDLTLSTTGANNEIRLTTLAAGSEIILQTSAAPIELNASGNIDLTSTTNINCTSEILNVTNNAVTGSEIQMQGGVVGSVLNLENNAGNDNIILTGTNGTLQLGAAASSTGDLQVKNTLNDVVAQLDVDGNDAGQLTLFDDFAGTATQSIFLSGNTGLGEFGGANTSGELSLIASGSTNISIEAINSTVKLVGKTGLSTPLDRVLLMGEPTATVGGFAPASALNGGIAATIYGGLTILPNRDYNGVPNVPMYDSNIIMGQYGWNTTTGINTANVYLSNKNDQSSIGYGGSGNIYCNQIRQNIYSSGSSTPLIMGSLAFGFTGNGFGRQFYNGGNVRYLTVATNQEPNSAKEIVLPPINEAMLGMTITIVRLRQNPVWFPGNNAAGIPRSEIPAFIYPDTTSTDLLSAPESIFVQSGSIASGGGIALDPYGHLVTAGGYTTPSPYSEIGSATVVASAYGDGQVIQGTPSRYFWHYIDAYPGK